MKSQDGTMDPEKLFDFAAKQGVTGLRNKAIKPSPDALEPMTDKIKPKGTRFQS